MPQTPGKPGTPRPLPAEQTAPVTVPPTPANLEATNPTGTPEGTDHAHVGALAETRTTPLGTPGAVQPTAADLGSTVDTQSDRVAPGAPEDYVLVEDPLQVLVTYLAIHHPLDVRTDEHPAVTATRLLARLGASTPTGARCQAPYCNLPALHHGEHGWVHVEPVAAR